MKFLLVIYAVFILVSTAYTKSVYEMTIEEFKKTLGSKDIYRMRKNRLGTKPEHLITKWNDSRDEIVPPPYYSVLEKWPECKLPVRNQGNCGSCWAFGDIESLEDKFCIQNPRSTKTPIRLSTQNMVSCNHNTIPDPGYIFEDCKGCEGGSAYCSLPYLTETGTVSEECQPYKSGGTGENGECMGDQCVKEGISNKRYKCKADTWFTVEDPLLIKQELIANGPVSTFYLVYRDFKDYRSGIYYRATDELLGGHGVKIIGWGIENGIHYWIAQNSWTADWGENGFFRIQVGQCRFAEMAFGCEPLMQ